MRHLVAVWVATSFFTGCTTQRGVFGTPAMMTFQDTTCRVLGDHLQTLMEPDRRSSKPFETVNGYPTLTFDPPGGYKAVYTFGGTLTHVPLQRDFCRVEVNAAGPTPENATKRNHDALDEMETFVICRSAKDATGVGGAAYRNTIAILMTCPGQ
jgi:hypothetical protein